MEDIDMYFTSGESRGLYWITVSEVTAFGEQQTTWWYAEKDMVAWVMCKTALTVAMEER